MKKQKGFTLPEMLFVIWFVILVIILGGGAYIGLHFIAKFW
jgi:prepilin-type N-terminal cleavage/methylation domain-containing protein